MLVSLQMRSWERSADPSLSFVTLPTWSFLPTLTLWVLCNMLSMFSKSLTLLSVVTMTAVASGLPWKGRISHLRSKTGCETFVMCKSLCSVCCLPSYTDSSSSRTPSSPLHSYRLHRLELNALTDPEQRYRRLVELNVIEQCLNLFKTGVVQKKRVDTYNEGGEYTTPQIHACVFDPNTGDMKKLQVSNKMSPMHCQGRLLPLLLKTEHQPPVPVCILTQLSFVSPLSADQL
jgi:hypothetical protein